MGALRQERVERGDDPLGEVRKLMERWEGRFTLDYPRLVERYLKRELQIVVVLVAFAASGLGNAEDFCAVFERELPVCDAEGDRHGSRWHSADGGGREDDVPVGCPDGEQESVLIRNVETVQTPEGVVPSLVRLQRGDHVFRGVADALCYSRRFGFVILPGPPNRERRFVGGVVAVGEHELVDEKIEAGPQVVDGVADNRAPTGRRLFADLHAPDLVARVRLVLCEDTVWIGPEECPDLGIKLVDVLLGPLNLDSGAV